jgi:hypothetical protein
MMLSNDSLHKEFPMMLNLHSFSYKKLKLNLIMSVTEKTIVCCRVEKYFN